MIPRFGSFLGYAALRSGDRFETLRAYGEALRLQPKNREAADAMAGVLLELSAPFAAGALLPETPLGIQVRQAGALVRWGGHVVPRDPRLRFEGTDAALKRLEALLRKARSARTPDAGLIVRLRRDRVVALRLRERWADAVAQTQELRADGDQIPPYVREAEADSLLALRLMPETLRGLWRQRLRWSVGGTQAVLDSTRALFSGKRWRLLPIWINYIVSILWAYAIVIGTAFWVIAMVGIPLPDWAPILSPIPGAWGIVLAATYLLQSGTSVLLDSRFEP